MDVQKLAKVLALAASDNESESLHALRTAKRMMDAGGVDFVELARHFAQSGPAKDSEALEDAVFDLRNEIRHLRAENERLRQAKPSPAPAPAEPPSFHSAARDAAETIRLRVELADLTEELERERHQVMRLRDHQTTMHEQFQEALAEAGKLGFRLQEAESKRMRLEAENRRLLHANHALTVELEELKVEKGRAAVESAAHEVRQDLEGKKPKRELKSKTKAGTSQYALL